jgi:tetratricopeptide (TPR) repeat protein
MIRKACRAAVEFSCGHGACVALAAAVIAGAGCASGRGPTVPVDAVVRELAGSARVAYERGEAARAAELYQRALARARLVDDADESARNAYNLALCRMAEGKPDETRGLLAQARALLPPHGAEIARTWLAEAEAAVSQGLLEDARSLVGRGLEAGADAAGRAQAHLLLARLACGTAEWQIARAELSSARRAMGRSEVPELRARAEGIVARVARANGEAAAAAAALERQAGWFKRAGRFGDMAGALMEAGEGYRTAGLSPQAYVCLMRAAASLKAQDRDKALIAAMTALSVAQALKAPEWEAAASGFIAEIKAP